MAILDVRLQSPVSQPNAQLAGATFLLSWPSVSAQPPGDTNYCLLVVAGLVRPATPGGGGGPTRTGRHVGREVEARPWIPRGARAVGVSRWTAEPRSGLGNKRQERLGENIRV